MQLTVGKRLGWAYTADGLLVLVANGQWASGPLNAERKLGLLVWQESPVRRQRNWVMQRHEAHCQLCAYVSLFPSVL